MILFFVENFVFWSLVITIAWFGANAPAYVFTALYFFLLYWGLRMILSLKGMDKALGIYTLNLVVVIGLLFYFLNK
jgi:hypothetical protein